MKELDTLTTKGPLLVFAWTDDGHRLKVVVPVDKIVWAETDIINDIPCVRVWYGDNDRWCSLNDISLDDFYTAYIRALKWKMAE